MRSINSRPGWRCAARSCSSVGYGAAAGWSGSLLAAARCLHRFFHLCKTKHMAWGRKGPHCAGRCWSEGDRVAALTGAVGGLAGSAPSTSTQPELRRCLSCRALLELAEVFAGGITLERARKRICPPQAPRLLAADASLLLLWPHRAQ